MISVSLDEGIIFDMLSIYEVKLQKNPTDLHKNTYESFLKKIRTSVGSKKLSLILNSQEYQELLIANTNTFELVDMVKNNPCLGKEIDNSNYERYLKKKALQKKFFNSDISEHKIGYNEI